MYNWRLLLLAFVAVFQPIASFNERNLVDGRPQCCDHRFERDSPYSLYGSRLKHPSEDRYTSSHRRETREVRSDERRHENVLVTLRTVDSIRDSRESESRRSLDLGTRSPRAVFQREKDVYHQRRSVVSYNRARNTREELRDTDRIRIAPNRVHVYRDIIRVSSAGTINRDLSHRTRNVVSRPNIERSNDSERKSRHMKAQTNEINVNRDTRERHFEQHHARNGVKYDRRGDNGERRVSGMERNHREMRSLDRSSKGSEENRRFSPDRVIEEDRIARINSRDNFRNEHERKVLEMRVRERVEVNRMTTSRSTTTPLRLDHSLERRSLSRSIRRDNEFRVSSNFGDRAYEFSNNIRNDHSERRITRERNNLGRHSPALNREKSDDRALSADRRSIRQMQNIRQDIRDVSRNDVRNANVDDQRSRETNRLSRSASRLTENRLSRALSFREQEINEYRRTSANDRIAKNVRDMRQQSVLSREDNRGRRESISETRRSRTRSEEISQKRRDEPRASRERSQRFRERYTSEQRPTRENQRRITDSRDYRLEEPSTQRNTMNERLFPEKTISGSTKQSSRINNRVVIERTNERREIRNVYQKRETSTENSMRRAEVRTRIDVNPARNYLHKFSPKNIEPEGQVNELNWQYLIYTLQGIYLCSILMQMIMVKNENPKKTMNYGWWTPIQNTMKMD